MGRPALHSAVPFGLASIPLSGLLGVVRAVGDRLHEGLYLLDVHGRLQYANPAALRVLGVQRESQVRGRDIGALLRRAEGEISVHAHNMLDDGGETAAQLCVVTCRGTRSAPGPAHVSAAPTVDGGRFLVRDPETLDLDGASLGCLVVRLISDAPEDDVEAVLRDLAHLIARVTRPEDMVVRIDADTVALFARTDTLAGVKSIAERVTARGRREICDEFRVGIALGGPGDTAVTLVRSARATDYTTKPRMRGRVAVRRSGVPTLPTALDR